MLALAGDIVTIDLDTLLSFGFGLGGISCVVHIVEVSSVSIKTVPTAIGPQHP